MPLVTICIAIATLVLACKGLKNWRVDKTVELYRTMRKERDILLDVSRNETEEEYRINACYDYLNEIEAVLCLKKQGKLDKTIFNELIQPQIIGFVDNDVIEGYIYKMKEVDKKQGFPDTYRNLSKLIEEQEKKNVKK